MSTRATDTAFDSSIPRTYQSHLVPLIFEPYAEDLAARVAARSPARVLEIGAGTGVVTRRLAAVLAPTASIIASDLNQAMLDVASAVGTARTVEWRQADALQLPFRDGQFDAVVCQFTAMFFPDKTKAFAEARRVLQPGGTFLFNVWDRIEENELADTVTAALAAVFPENPPRFMARTPHGYHDPGAIRRDLASAGFATAARIENVAARSRAESARAAAIAYCQGTPLRNEINERDPKRLDAATTAAAEAIERRFGRSAIDAKIQALVVAVEKT